MLAALRRFLSQPAPSRVEVAGVLRGVFVAMFLTQTAVAALLAGALALVTGFTAPAGALTSQILVVLALAQVPVGAGMAYFAGRGGGKGAALAATLMAGVLLATPAWFLAFAALVGSSSLYLVVLLIIVVNAYGVGFFLCGRFAAFAVVRPSPLGDGSAGQG